MRFKPLAVVIIAVLAFFGGRASDGLKLPDIIPDGIVTPPAPIAEDGLTVIIVREATEGSGMTPAQLSAIDSGTFHDYLTAKNARWRKFDPDHPPTLESQAWQDAWAKHVASRPKTDFPLLIVSNGKTGDIVPLPSDLAGLMTVVRKYGDAL